MNKKESANIYIIISIICGYLLSFGVFQDYREGVRSAYLTNLLNIINLAVITIAPIIIYVLADRKEFAKIFKKSSCKRILLYIVIAPVVWCAATYINSRVNRLLMSHNIMAITQLPQGKGTKAVISGFVLTCVAAPILEEIFYRGVILNLLKGYGAGGAIAISAFLFAAGHGSITVFALPFIYGLVFGYVTIKSGSIYPAIIMHFICNFMSWTLSVFEIGQTFNIIISVLGIMVGAGALVWAIIKLIRKSGVAASAFTQMMGYIKNPMWIPIVLNYIYMNINNHR